ncbi:hypothetical protein MMC34_007842 [Xylographa carneopallida]|nr:hypothetical protein [Xylographa carneopallida]
MVSSSTQTEDGAGSASPPAPPYSPITPVMPTATLAPAPIHHAEDFPAVGTARAVPVPVSESYNPDALALRSAISILQIQRQRTLRDLQSLQRQKTIAVADPELFAHELRSGNVKSASGPGVLGGERPDLYFPESQTGTSRDDPATQEGTSFGMIPTPQNIVRCPPVNWAKYLIVGEALDNLHEEQRSHPSPGEPQRDFGTSKESDHVVAAPYRPWADKIPASPAQSRSPDKKGSRMGE